MRFEVPECSRCLFCLPLRRGIITFGYLNLLFSTLVLALDTWVNWGEPANTPTMGLFRGVHMYTHKWFPTLLYSLEIIFNMLLIIGGHVKNKTLIRCYYYYGITTTAAAFVVAVVVRYQIDFNTFGSTFDLIDLALSSCGMIIHVYLLLLIRSELKKPRYRTGTSFVNHVAEVITPPPWEQPRNPF
ncbi:hypothetical protein ACJJTC_006325 [Scirpophaga incertulas]